MAQSYDNLIYVVKYRTNITLKDSQNTLKNTSFFDTFMIMYLQYNVEEKLTPTF